MQLYSTQQLCLGELTLDAEESQHVVRVMRQRNGDFIRLTDGSGRFADAEILNADPKICSVRIAEILSAPLPFPCRITLGVAITKNSERFEWFAEKATEIGVSSICPLVCEHSERKKMNVERLGKVIKSAAKQSLHYHFPEVSEPLKLDGFLKCQGKANVYIAVCNNPKSVPLTKAYAPFTDACVLIGPEGDFSEKELSLAENVGAVPVSLGPYRLRTETAALAACMNIHLINEVKD